MEHVDRGVVVSIQRQATLALDPTLRQGSPLRYRRRWHNCQEYKRCGKSTSAALRPNELGASLGPTRTATPFTDESSNLLHGEGHFLASTWQHSARLRNTLGSA